MRTSIAILAGTALASLVLVACGPARSYTPVNVPGWEYILDEFPEPPLDLPEDARRSFEQGWSALIEGDFETAVGDLERLDKQHQGNPSVSTALGYLDLRLGNRAAAETRFNDAMRRNPGLASAQAGSALTALSDGQEEVAFERLRNLEKIYSDHPLVRRYLPNLQLKLAESKLQAARDLKRQQKYAEAAEIYRQALDIAPGAGGLYREAAEVELLSDEPKAAAEHVEKAIELEPDNPQLHLLRGDALAAAGELELAVEAYEKAHELRPEDNSITVFLDRMRRELERESLPPQYAEIAQAERLTREQLAALLFVRLRPLLEAADLRGNVIATDIGGSWARLFIREIVGAEIMSVFSNHTFQPTGFVRRVELAVTLAAAVDALSSAPVYRSNPQLDIRDVSPENLNYRSVALVVSLGLVDIDNEGRFEPTKYVTGAEAVKAVDTLAERLAP